MKKTTFLTFILLVAVLMWESCSGGSKSKTPKKAKQAIGKTAIMVLVDNTDKRPDCSDMISEKKLANLLLGPNKDGSGTIFFKTITNVSLTSETPVAFNGGEEPNQLMQVKARKAFLKKLDSPYHKCLAAVTQEVAHSVVYTNVCQAANELCAMEADQKILIIMSDLVEHSELGNFYQLKPTAACVKQAIEKLLASGSKLPKDPDDFKVILLFNSRGNERDDAAFNNSLMVWKKLFKDNGIEFEEPRANL